MDTSTDGYILLVGEGDFSFCVAMVSKLPSNKRESILATSLETEESIKKHQNAVENIQWLRDRGVTVKLNTDATQLHSDPYFSGRQFSQIIFNFPHTGGKSNHKRNRKLLNDFFTSAVQVLENEGQIMVTLAKGQGGTPADKPMRAWHDSWQVVSMAANSDLILVKALPFIVDQYDTYSSTGFRSLDKGFNTKNAITHVFVKADQVDIPAHLDEIPVTLHKQVYMCSRYLYKKLNVIRLINGNKNHPINRIYHAIEKCISSEVGTDDTSTTEVRNLGLYRPILKGPNNRVVTKVSENEAYFTRGKTVVNMLKGYDFQKPDCRSIGTKNENIDCFDEIINSDQLEIEGFYLVSDPLGLIGQRFLSQNQKREVKILYGPVFKPCNIEPGVLPVTYHMIITWPLSHDTLQSHDLCFESLKKYCKPSLDTIIKVIENVISMDGAEVEVKLVDKMREVDISSNIDTKCEKLYLIGHLICRREKPSTLDSTKYDEGNISEIGSVYLVQSLESSLEVSQYFLMFTIDLCQLACRRYGLTNERLLWSNEHRVLNQFMHLDQMLINPDQGLINSDNVSKPTCTAPNENGAPMIVQLTDLYLPNSKYSKIVASPSLFPMTFTQDMSFWENEALAFDELKYCDIIRDIADDTVISVELLDTFSDAESVRTSRCYRLVFQSADRALSYDTSWKLQSLIRLEVEKKMKIKLR